MSGGTRLANGACSQYDEAFVRGSYLTICSPGHAPTSDNQKKAFNQKERCFTAPPAQLVDGSDGPLVCSFDEAQRGLLGRLAPALSGLGTCECGGFETCDANALRIGCHDCKAETGLHVADVRIGACATNVPLVFISVVLLIVLAGFCIVKAMRWEMHSALDDLLDECVLFLRTPLKWCRAKWAALAACCWSCCLGMQRCAASRVAPEASEHEGGEAPPRARCWSRVRDGCAACLARCRHNRAPKLEPHTVQVKAHPLGMDIDPAAILGAEAAKQKGGTPAWW